MKNPNPINLMTTEEVRTGGWAAETRDSDGHLVCVHASFDGDEDFMWFVQDAMECGETVTIWPQAAGE